MPRRSSKCGGLGQDGKVDIVGVGPDSQAGAGGVLHYEQECVECRTGWSRRC